MALKVGQGKPITQPATLQAPAKTPKIVPAPAAERAPLDVVKTSPAKAAPTQIAEVGAHQGERATAEAQHAGAASLGWTSETAAAKTAFDDPKFDAYLDEATHSRSRTGNEVRLLFDGVVSFSARGAMIVEAKKSINFQTFIFNSDATGWDLAKRLADKAKQGVKVRVIYDAMGSNRADKKMFEMMKQAGVEIRPYGDPLTHFWDINDRWHEKHLIVDGAASIEGGMNVADEYALGGSGRLIFSRGNAKGDEAWRDTDIKVQGPAVQDAQAAFLRNWKELGPEVPEAERAEMTQAQPERATNVSVRVVQHRPDEEGDKNVELLYLKAIDTATKSITIENAYFVPPKSIREALIRAAQRGVDVRITTNSHASNDFGAVSDASRYFYDELIAAGVHINEKQGGTLHAKTATFDGAYSIVGSANLNGRSKGRDSEVVIAVKDPKIAKRLEGRYEQGLPHTKAVTMDELEHESLLTNLKQWACSTLAWTF